MLSVVSLLTKGRPTKDCPRRPFADWAALRAIVHRATVLGRLGPLLLGIGCGQSEERPLPAGDDCGGQVCTMTGVGPVPGSAGPAPSAADAGASNPLLTGDVRIATSPDLTTTRALSNATVSILGRGPKGNDVSVDYDGSPDFELRISDQAPIWVRVLQQSGSASLLTTYQTLESAHGAVTLLVLERSTVAEIGENLALNPLALDAEAAHFFVRFVDDQGAPQSGVAVEVPSGGTVAYDIGATYTDANMETSDRGTVAIMNVPAVPLPGGGVRVVASFAGESTNITVQAAQDSVSVTTVEL